MAEEVAIYQDANIQITSLRAMLHGKTYAMANVTSVSMYTQLADKTLAIVLAIAGGLWALIGLFSYELRGCSLFFGILMVVIGAAIAASKKDVYWIRIGSASGETNALRSHDHDYIARVVNAMNEAIVRRG